MDEDKKPKKALVEKEPKTPTAKRIKDLDNYTGDVALFELSKGLKKGAKTFKYVVVARYKPTRGVKNTTVWLSDDSGVVSFIEPIKEFKSVDMNDAVEQLGYKLV